VRIEIATALRREIPVIPILLNGASLPAPEQLPEDLQPLLRRQACALTDVSFRTSVARLVDQLGEILDDRRKAPPAPEAPQRAPASAPAPTPDSAASASATAIALKRDDKLCVLEVRLASERHIVSYAIGFVKDTFEVDGVVVARPMIARPHEFILSDEGTPVRAVIEVALTGSGMKIATVILRVGGAVVYQG
jgi:hypothetical protein